MKKAILVITCIFASTLSFANPRTVRYDSPIGPATSTSNVTISAQSGVRNCITHVSTISSSTNTFRMLDGATTNYALLLGAGQGYVADFNPEAPWCTSPSRSLTLSVDGGTFSINYDGYSY